MKEIKFKKREMKKDAAVLIAAFGSTTTGRLAYDRFNKHLLEKNLVKRLAWAYTSEIIREKMGCLGVLEVLASLEAEGYRKVIVQPLHIFPATEYGVLESMCRSFPGLSIVMGETLMHRWKFVDQVFEAISKDFLAPEEGLNVVVGHGTPLCADPANAIYLNVDHYFTAIYPNVHFVTVDGVPSMDMLFPRVEMFKKQHAEKNGTSVLKARIIPFMYVAGMHVQEDLLAEEGSLLTQLTSMGFEVDYAISKYQDRHFPKTLAFYDEIIDAFTDRIERALELMMYY